MGFPTKNDHFGVFWGYPYFLETPMLWVSTCFFLPRICTWSIVVFLFGWIYNSYVTCFVNTSSGSCVFELFQKMQSIKKVCDAYHQKKMFLQTSHHFLKPPVRVIIQSLPPKKNEKLTRGKKKAWWIDFFEKNGLKVKPNLFRMLSLATQKMPSFWCILLSWVK